MSIKTRMWDLCKGDQWIFIESRDTREIVARYPITGSGRSEIEGLLLFVEQVVEAHNITIDEVIG